MLVDTSVWVQHLPAEDPALSALLNLGEVECHPFVIDELACGTLRRRSEILALLRRLRQVPLAHHDEVLMFVQKQRLMGCGIGWIDAHLLASAALEGTVIWTLDRTFIKAAQALGLCVQPWALA